MRTARKRLVTSSLALALFGLGAGAPPALGLRITPESPATPNAETSLLAYVVMFVIALALIVAINLAIVMAVRRFRGGRDVEPRRRRVGRGFNATLTAGLSAAVVVLFVFGVITTEASTDEEPGDSGAERIEISTSGQQWLWRYEYPDGTYSFNDLYVPVDTPIRLSIDSIDVLHRYWVPALGGAVDATPGNEADFDFTADETGVYEGRSTEFSGAGFAAMRTKVHVVEPAEYEAWLEEQAAEISEAEEAIRERLESQTPQEATE